MQDALKVSAQDLADVALFVATAVEFSRESGELAHVFQSQRGPADPVEIRPQADMVAVVDDTDQQEEVVDAVDNCQRQNTRGICVAAGTYSQKNLKKVLTPISTQLDPLIEESGEGEIVPGVYALAGSKQNYSDEIACLLVRNFGQPGEVRSDMLAVVSDPIQQQTVLRAIRTCERDRGDSYCTAMRGVRGKAADTTFDAQRSVYSSAENPSRDVATSVTPSF